jgi:hypothetical protein
MAGEKPTAAMVLSIIGGLFILFAGIAYLAIANVLSFLILIGGETFPGVDPVLVIQIFGILGVVIGIVIMAGGVLMYMNPARSTMWGVIILVVSLVSIIASGGFFLGLILGLIGGILGIVFKPSPAMPAPAPAAMPPPAAPAPAPAPAPEEPAAPSDEE